MSVQCNSIYIALIEIFCLCVSILQQRNPQAHVIRGDAKMSQTPWAEKDNSQQVQFVEVDFLTSVERNFAEFVKMDYHVIDYTNATSHSVRLQITKKVLTPKNFRIVIWDGDDTEVIENVEVDCIFSGSVISTVNNTSSIDGVAAISMCDQPGKISGMIIKGDGHWMIEPFHLPHGHNRETNVTTKRVPHRLRRGIDLIKNSTGQLSLHPDDELHVPKDKLLEAVKEAIEDNNKASKTKAKAATNGKRVDSPLLIEPTIENSINPQMLIQFEPIDNTLKTGTATGSNSGSKSASQDSSKQLVVELGVFTDPEFYEEMKVRYPTDTAHKIKDYVLTLINGVDLLYEQKSLGMDMKLRINHLEILKTLPSNLKKNGKSAKDYLQSFCEYAGNKNKDRTWDHGLMLTGSDLREAGSSATAGLAWAGTMCLKFYSCSVSEALQLGSVYVIAHEIGHGLGMDHDGSGTCKSCDAEKFLMRL